MKISAILLAGVMAFTLAACGSGETAGETAVFKLLSETEVPSESETTEEEPESEIAPEGVWESDSERVTIEDDTVTIDYVDDEGGITETYWVGSCETDESNREWTSERDPEAEMTADCDTIEFTWEGMDDIYDTLSYAVTNDDGSQTTVRLERTESFGENAEEVVPDFNGSDSETADDSVFPSAGTYASVSDNGKTDDNTAAEVQAADTGSSASDSAAAVSRGTTSGSTSGTAASGQSTGSSGSSPSSSNTGTANSSGGTASSNNGNSSSGSAAAACSHNYQSSVKTAATCSSTGTMKYTCTKCGDSYETTIPATGNHNWQAIYKTVHHDATGHYETVTVQEAVYGYRYVCNKCGYVASVTGEEGGDEVYRHIRREHDNVASYSSKYVCLQEAVTEQQWVVDTAAYDEQAIDYYRCMNCGAVK